ncbi:hypothetical protein G1C97_0320 [Bifidobacterium sp. DSM 109959]|uniref:Uncharacterized protein n=1 Tax=Bifidobacterium olomucense TaxID=2675324 RepID=A0A7Y0EVW1_9BIFI|nr:hypothetical protein [Bifidobacterium sp. DSM 109959]
MSGYDRSPSLPIGCNAGGPVGGPKLTRCGV